MRNLKRALSLALASVMLLGMMVVGTSAASYPDVDSADNLEAIEVLKMVGVMTGDENGNFNPDQMVTRNEMAVVMCNLLGLKTGGSHPFTDVPDWAAPYVAACYNNGIIAGVSANKFNGSASVTAVQAGLMVMKALGYFGYQGEFADDWKLAVVKQADKINLYDGINAYTDQDMTRNEIAQMVLNALECTIQVVTEQGGLTVDGNGIIVSVKATYDYDDAENNSGKDYLGRNNKTMELCEKLYNNNLKKVENYTAGDDFGRPSTKWTYGNDNIVTPNEPDLTYTKEVKGKEIYADLGKVTPDNIIFIRNNKTETSAYTNSNPASVLAIDSSDNEKIGGKGTLIEVYYNNDDLSNTTATIVVVDTFLAKASEDFDKDDEEVDVTIYSTLETAATLSSDDFAVANVEEDDYLLVNLAYDGSKDYEVKAVSFPSIVENAVVSTARSDDYVIADGTKYEYASVAKADTAALGQDLMASAGKYDINGDGYNLYLDAYGYVVGVEGYDAGVNLDDYLFVKEVSTNGFDVIAKVLFMDGTTKTVTVDKIGGNDVKQQSDIATKLFYTFDTDKDGNYELTVVPTTGPKTETQSKANSATVDNVAQPISGVANAGTSTTLFIAKDKVYTGVKNAPEVKTAGAVYYVLDENARLLIVYSENKGSASSTANDLVYILNSNPAKAKDGDDTYYIYDAIVDGVKTTLDANDNSKPAGVYEIETYTDGRADLGTAITDVGVTNELVNYLGTISSADYKDGTLTLGDKSYLVSDDVTIITIDGNTVKTISASGVKKAVTDGFKIATAIETSSSNSDIITVYLSK